MWPKTKNFKVLGCALSRSPGFIGGLARPCEDHVACFAPPFNESRLSDLVQFFGLFFGERMEKMMASPPKSGLQPKSDGHQPKRLAIILTTRNEQGETHTPDWPGPTIDRVDRSQRWGFETFGYCNTQEESWPPSSMSLPWKIVFFKRTPLIGPLR